MAAMHHLTVTLPRISSATSKIGRVPWILGRTAGRSCGRISGPSTRRLQIASPPTYSRTVRRGSSADKNIRAEEPR
jgi:hypothetical protein